MPPVSVRYWPRCCPSGADGLYSRPMAAADALLPLAPVRFRKVQFGRSHRHRLRNVVYAVVTGDLNTMSAESPSALGAPMITSRGPSQR